MFLLTGRKERKKKGSKEIKVKQSKGIAKNEGKKDLKVFCIFLPLERNKRLLFSFSFLKNTSKDFEELIRERAMKLPTLERKALLVF